MRASLDARHGLAIGLAVLALVSLAPSSPAASATRHAGVVVAVDPQARTLTVDELAPGRTPVHRTLRVQVPPDARVLLSQRNPQATGVDDAFRDAEIGVADIRRGDYVVVELAIVDGRRVARMVMVTLQGSGT